MVGMASGLGLCICSLAVLAVGLGLGVLHALLVSENTLSSDVEDSVGLAVLCLGRGLALRSPLGSG